MSDVTTEALFPGTSLPALCRLAEGVVLTPPQPKDALAQEITGYSPTTPSGAFIY
jgi:hypothetical protein